MSIVQPLRILAATVALAFITSAGPALAVDNPLIGPRISAGELQTLRSQQQRQDFQQRQQLNREMDSRSIGRQQPRIEVPVMKPNCRPRRVGNKYIAQNC